MIHQLRDDIEVTDARDLYEAEYRYGRNAFTSVWEYDGIDAAFISLWDDYCLTRKMAIRAAYLDDRRKHIIRANALWALYQRQCAKWAMPDPEEGIPF